ncbi:ribokinase [Paenarthrobacter aromaticivorans]|uniref:Ribokinase n=1 Tax=Paenarthrobacter aromaticivorans TaxID=2849150 RepID=A0ABS6IAC4_9MICC|nr:ribokinase [Paenarthrobacter sp. MMS21-TAE1-1]MBU8868663.1 ribokinase [Paenarthrobacter sp. MMS21-TAE1-1]
MSTDTSARTAGIVVVGSLNADLTIYCDRLPKPGETVHGNGFAVNPGGKSANQAVAASKLGAQVSLVGAVGDDANGSMLLESTADAGVDVTRVRRSDAATGVAVISVDASGENSIIISAGANGTLTPADVRAAADTINDAAVVCLCLEVAIDTVIAAAQAGNDAGATVVLNLSPYAEVPEILAELSDVLLVNAHEASLFLGGEADVPDADAEAEAWEPVRSQFADRGLQRVLVTLGAHGSVVLDSFARGTQDQITRIAPTRVSAVDTTGAGDAFTGAVAARLAAGESLADAASFASVAAALAATKKGTQAAYPTLAQVEQLRGV